MVYLQPRLLGSRTSDDLLVQSVQSLTVLLGDLRTFEFEPLIFVSICHEYIV